MSRICLVGAGNIARTHAEAVAMLPGHHVACVVDPDLAAARRLAGPVGPVYASVEAALAEDAFDRAHVLVPPGLHAEVAARLLAAGKPVLLEKPLAASAQDCVRLLAAAAASGAVLGVNQNFIHHPAFVRLRERLDAGAIGRARSVQCVYNVALRQMAARQFGHWMFDAPANLLLEQAVHPLSQIAALAGPIGAVQATGAPVIGTGPGRAFCPSFSATLEGGLLPAQLRFAVGEAFAFWQVTVVGDDGVLVADILADRLLRYGRTRWLEAVDGLASGLATASGLAGDSLRNAAGYVASTLRLRPRGDPFFRSMRASIAAFHGSLDRGENPALDGAFGADLVAACLRLAQAAVPAAAVPAAAVPAAAVPAAAVPAAAVMVAAPAIVSGSEARCDVAVLGGTGFIGAHVVARLLRDGLSVAVMARSVRGLAAPFDDERVRLHRGDIRDPAAVRAAIGSAPIVVNLAHGGGGADFAAVRDAMLGGAETVARACLDLGVRRLLHVGSIASLYLGPQAAPITGATPPDPREVRRGDYARAKALCDRMLLELHARDGLPVSILRPGVVVGEGGPPFHSGLGFANTEQHVIGWNDGRNPLPFVLVADVAEAIRLACAAPGIDGRCYNLVGDVRLSAREYVAALAAAMRRPLAFHPQSERLLWLEELGKWTVKRAGGRAVPPPSLRDLRSRGMRARFDCADAARDLGWRPVTERAEFLDQAVQVHEAA